MHFSKKLISCSVIAVLMIGLIFQGHSYEKSKEEQIEQIVDSTETVRLWYSDDSLTDYFTNAAVAFHEKNPEIRVIPVLVDSSEYLDNIYNQSILGEDFPDVYIASNDSLEKAYLSGIASEIQQKDAVNVKHFSQAAIDAVTYKKQLIGYPLFFETSVLAYNRTYLERWADAVNSGEATADEGKLSEEDLKEALGDVEESAEISAESEEEKVPVTADNYIPKNIDELLAFSDAYNAPDTVTGIFRWDVTDVFYNYFFVGNYLNVGGPTGDDTENIDIYNANAISCLEVYQALNQFFSIDAENSSYKAALDDFTSGKSVFTVVTSDAVKTIREAQKEALDKFKEADELAREEAKHRTQIEQNEAMGAKVEASQDDDSKEAESDKASDDKKEESSDDMKEDEPTELQKAADELKTKVFDMEFARIPMVSKDLDAKSLSVTNALLVNGFSKHMAAANKFAEFATTGYCASLYQKSGKIAASLDADYEDEDLKIFQSEYANSIPLPKMMEAGNFWVQLEVLFTKVWRGEDIQPLLVNLSDQIANQKVEEE
ncbi:MAG: extracellular solute-binding protein [Lachnospiraceae bacterium]|nr:extracellular solute-binding protein [Lachnospiraceae bacterium]